MEWVLQLIKPRSRNKRKFISIPSQTKGQLTTLPFIFLELLFVLSLVQLSSNSFLGSRTSGSLYGPEDKVYILNSTTIKQEIFNSNRAWLVEFFSSWCGHCVAFAPKWKQFAQDLNDWQSMVVIAGIDCADEPNIPTCRDFEIMGYPTLKIFPPHAARMIENSEQQDKDTEKAKMILNTGTVFERPESMKKLKTLLMEALVPMFPDQLSPLNISTSTSLLEAKDFFERSIMFKNEPFSFIVLIYEAPLSHIGLEIALRLSQFKDKIHVVRFNRKNSLYKTFQFQQWPAFGYVTRDGSFGSINLENDQDMVSMIVKSVLGLAKVEQTSALPKLKDSDSVKEDAQVDSPVAEAGKPKLEFHDKVSMEDLLHTVRNMLRNEIGLFSRIDGVKLDVLKKFIGVLAQYFPADRREVQLFFISLSEWILAQREVQEATFTQKLNELEEKYHPWEDIDLGINSWKDCKGEIPGRRGYTCGLWRLFHTLTVIAFDRREDSPVLPAIYGYVQEFFGCRECASHFSSMVSRDSALELQSVRQQMRWLWKAHNVVNLRLKGTPSEDPSHPKQLYPSRENCPSCYIIVEDRDDFDEDNVEEYLVKVYTKFHRSKRDIVKDVGLPDSISTLSKSTKRFGDLFSSIDIGIFMILYVCVACLLVLGYLHFKISKRRRSVDPISYLRRICSERGV